MEEMMILELLICVGLTLIAYKIQSWPIAFVSSLGITIIGLNLFTDSGDWLILALTLGLAFSQILICGIGDSKS